MDDSLLNNFRLTSQPFNPELYLSLMFECFQKHFSKDWFYWFHHQSPWGKSRVYTAWHEQRMVATITFLPLHLIIGNIVQKGSIYVNAMTHPDFQRLGLNVALLEYAKSDAIESNELFSITFPTTYRHSIKNMLKTGWKIFDDIHYWELPRPQIEGNLTATKVPRVEVNVKSLLRIHNQIINLGVKKTVDYLNWRTVKRPDIDYEIYSCGPLDKPKGLLILKHYHKNKVRKTHIMELISKDDDSINLLLQTAETVAFHRGSTGINIWLSNEDICRPMAESHGFRRTKEKNIFLLFPYKNMIKQTSQFKNHFALVDNDVY